MAQNTRFGLSVRLLTLLAKGPDAMQTSFTLAASLGTSAVMVRRLFSVLHKAGLIVQRKGPRGGAQLKQPAKSIGLGDIYMAVEGELLPTGDKVVDTTMRRARQDAVNAMNETTLATLVKRLKKS